MLRLKKYPDELMDRGVRLVIESGRPVVVIAVISVLTRRRCASAYGALSR